MLQKLLYRWLRVNRVILTNAGSLVGTTAITSALGFAYWWFAARYFAPEAVGLASASISAMMLIGNICMLGLGTLLISELPQQADRKKSLISSALIVAGGVGGGVGLIFALAAPYVSKDFSSIGGDAILFAIGVSFTAVTLVLDQALIGLLYGGLQLWRNSVFAVTKLLALILLSSLFFNWQKPGAAIYMTWVIGNFISLAGLAGYIIFRRVPSIKSYLPTWDVLQKLKLAAMEHHLLNLTLQIPALTLPLLVTILLSAQMNAWFYVSWMIAGFLFILPFALTMALYAIGVAHPTELTPRIRQTLVIASATSVLANCLLLVGTPHILGLFGHTYAEQGALSLHLLGIGAFPLIIKDHYITVCRVQKRIRQALSLAAIGVILELFSAALGAHLNGLSGLVLGWVIGLSIEALCMFYPVYKVAHSADLYIQPPVETQSLVTVKE